MSETTTKQRIDEADGGGVVYRFASGAELRITAEQRAEGRKKLVAAVEAAQRELTAFDAEDAVIVKLPAARLALAEPVMVER